ncbi:MAG: PEP-CTERM sorting domain-containing protein [Tepidisphaeraceae bacterium]
MSRFSYGLLAVMVVAGLSSAANAAVVFSDNFDGYANQAAFQAAWPSIATTVDTTKQNGTLSSTLSVSAPNSVHIPVSTTAVSTSTEFRHRRSFAETDTVGVLTNPGFKLTWSFDFFDSIGGNPQRNFANLQDGTAPGGTNQLIALGLNNNQLSTVSGGNYYMARILGRTVAAGPDADGGPDEGGTLGAGAFFKLNDFALSPLRTVGWHNLKVEITSDDGLSTDFRFYVDGILAETVLNFSTAATFRSWDNIAIGSGLTNGGATANFDNMFLEVVVPEPTSLALFGLAGFALLRRRRA